MVVPGTVAVETPFAMVRKGLSKVPGFASFPVGET